VIARKTIDELLEDARLGLDRIGPTAAADAIAHGAALIDIRSESQIAADGTVPGALWFARNVLEWRLDPDCDARDPRAPSLDVQVIVMCDQGYASSFAAANLQELGFSRATDLDGGFQAWRAAGLPVKDPPGPA
jgi:rhodanese-related sulfurtransferase